MVANNISRTVKSILEFKNLCEKEGDKFLKISSRNKKNISVAKIMLPHGKIIDITLAGYKSFIKSRSEMYKKLEEIDAVLITDFLPNDGFFKFKLGKVIINTIPGNFLQIYNCNLEFFSELEKHKNHKFLKWKKYEKKATGLVAEIEVSHNGNNACASVPLNKYNYSSSGFLTGEKAFYEYAKKNHHKIHTPYVGSKSHVLIEFKGCPHGIVNIAASEFKDGHICRECRFDQTIRGENHWDWAGGITPLYTFLRTAINPWVNEVSKMYNKRCFITGEKSNVDVHHLYPFKLIVKETLEILNLPIHKEMNMYSKAERKLLKQTCLELHFKYGPGVVISKEIHIKFHSLYRKKNINKNDLINFINSFYSHVKPVNFIDSFNDNDLKKYKSIT